MINLFKDEYYFLSNFYNAKVVFDGIEYRNNEAAFHSMKVLNKEDRKQFSMLNPSEAKKLGRCVKLREDWEDVKYDYMYLICKAKFSQNSNLRKKLLDTMGKYLEEGTTGWHDNDWGNCKCPKCIHIVGQNNLGKILMRIREELFIEDILKENIIKAKETIDSGSLSNKKYVCFLDKGSRNDLSKEIWTKLHIEFMREIGYYLSSNYSKEYVVTNRGDKIIVSTKEYYEENLLNDFYKEHFVNM